MAKAIGIVGSMSGKLGNAVFYNLANSNNKVTMAARVYRADVANPKTEPQAIQRMKMAPAVNFYRQLARLLDNAWQGQKYGTRSRQYFMSLAMSQSTGIPFIPKGEKRFFPGEYPISQGSLLTAVVSAIDNNLLTINVKSSGVTGSWGEVSQGIVNANFGLRDGDRLTFVFVGRNAQGDFVPAYTYVILNTTSEEDAATVLANSNLSFTGDEGANLHVGILNAVDNIVAGAFIVSRLDTSTGAAWQRSNSVMFCTPAYKTQFMGQAAYEAAIVTYMDSGSYTSDWYLNLGLTGSDTQGRNSTGSDSNVSVTSVANQNVTIGGIAVQVAIATMSDGTKRAYRSSGTPTYPVYQSGSNYYWQSNYPAANAAALSAIQAADSDVTGWLVIAAEEIEYIAPNEP